MLTENLKNLGNSLKATSLDVGSIVVDTSRVLVNEVKSRVSEHHFTCPTKGIRDKIKGKIHLLALNVMTKTA